MWQNVCFRLLRGNNRVNTKEAKEIAEQKLKRVGLKPEIADLFPSELSGGMQKRVGLARAIASNPEIPLTQIKERRFDLIERAQDLARAQIQAAEDERVFSTLDAVAQNGFDSVGNQNPDIPVVALLLTKGLFVVLL